MLRGLGAALLLAGTLAAGPALAAPPLSAPTSALYRKGFDDGAREAIAELRKGTLLLLGYGMPTDQTSAIYNTELSRIGVRWEGYGHGTDEQTAGWVAGRNAIVETAIKRRYGPGALDEISVRIKRRLKAVERISESRRPR